MAMTNHYEATFKDGTVAKRSSDTREYTHAVRMGGGNISWAGSLALARKRVTQPWMEIVERKLDLARVTKQRDELLAALERTLTALEHFLPEDYLDCPGYFTDLSGDNDCIAAKNARQAIAAAKGGAA